MRVWEIWSAWLHELRVTQTSEDEDGGVGDLLVPFIKRIGAIKNSIVAPMNLYAQQYGNETIVFGSLPRNGGTRLQRAVVIPMWSLLAGSDAGVQYNQSVDIYAYKGSAVHRRLLKDDGLQLLHNDQTRNEIGHFIIISKHLPLTKNWDEAALPMEDFFLRGYTARTWMNPFNFHRRMSYPNSVHRMTKYGIIHGWKRFTPYLAGGRVTRMEQIKKVDNAAFVVDKYLSASGYSSDSAVSLRKKNQKRKGIRTAETFFMKRKKTYG
ncbi:hypothetical protein Y032_0152g2892 [Ancylostoma ceylanicum]|uniref:Uncharacterized protein n=1 Tax=Ancylostoma ceylanicum TaxID=53326 RepID=A0A016T0N4_9BILA|nr:hypothetical protein Y032_0152g2892 [Ancylostoma ceylanicum]